MVIRVAILGSTGSIGTQTVELISQFPQQLRLIGIAARGTRLDILHDQIRAHHPRAIAVLKNIAAPDTSWLCGPDAMTRFLDEIADHCDVLVNAVEGIAGVELSLHAIQLGLKIALANKETMICAGQYIKKIASPQQIWPVDSEHSALAQAMRSGTKIEIAQLVLTASGGPFRGKKAHELTHVTPQEALRHPTWSMGDLISLNSATLINKAMEVIEAHELFDIDYDKIAVTVHPQSIVHSMVTFCDGATIAQASPPNMLIPIAYAITRGNRLMGVAPPLDFTQIHQWTFEPVDNITFPAIELARQVGKAKGVFPAIFTAASEANAGAFLERKISFNQIMQNVSIIIDKANTVYNDRVGDISDISEIRDAMQWAVQQTDTIISHKL